MQSAESVLSHAEQLLSWYWLFGLSRDERYALPLGTWVDRLYQTRETARSVAAVKGRPRATMAVWGPSASGKSTLISSYIDRDADEMGNGSALHWPGGLPARFLAVEPPRPADATALNPYTFGSDASGCVSRFSLCTDDQVPDPQHPVRVQLATPTQLLHAVAAGYLSECRTTNEAGHLVALDGEALLKKLDQLKLPPTAPRASRDAYEALYELVNVIEMMIHTGYARYVNLATGKQWQKSLRGAILEHRALLASREAVLKFAADVLWDGKKALTAVCHQLAKRSGELASQWGRKDVHCSLEVASLLLDIDLYKALTSDMPADTDSDARARVERVRRLARSLRWSDIGGRIVIAGTGTHPLINEDRDFGILQALVWELQIPLRRKVLETKSPQFCSFLERADLLDFPGVARAHPNLDGVRIDPEKLPQAEEHRLLTEVVKRGKTASIVTGYARGLEIDGFSLLVRVGDFPPQPHQLHAGISTWWKCFDPNYDPQRVPRARPPLPLNLVLTFFAKLVSDVAQAGVQRGLDPVFQTMLGKLEMLADPAAVTTFATTYKQFRDGQLPTGPALDRATREIRRDAAFLGQFASAVSLSSFDRMLVDGGMDFFFEQLAIQADPARKKSLLVQWERSAAEVLDGLLEEALPASANQDVMRRTAIVEMAKNLEHLLRETEELGGAADSAAYCGRLIRRLLDIDPESLEPLPLNAITTQVDLGKFVRKQFATWVTSRQADGEFAPLGLEGPSHVSRFLHYLLDCVPMQEVADWARKNFGYVDNRRDARAARRHLAMRMTNALAYGSEPPPQHRPFNSHDDESILERLKRFSDHEQGEVGTGQYRYLDSPHYFGVVLPFQETLVRVKDGPVGKRPVLRGDPEIRVIVDHFKAGASTAQPSQGSR